MPAWMSPSCRRISRVISANSRSESVSPCTSARSSPSSSSPRQAGEHAVVGEQAPSAEGWCSRASARRRGEAHVRQERARALAARLDARPVSVKAESAPCGRPAALASKIPRPSRRVAPALRGEAVGRIQQPQLRAHRLGPTAHRDSRHIQRPCTTSALASTSSMFAYPLNAIASRGPRGSRGAPPTPRRRRAPGPM